MRGAVIAIVLTGCGGPPVPGSPEPAVPTHSEAIPEPEPVPSRAPKVSPQSHLFPFDDDVFFETDVVQRTTVERRRRIRKGERGVRIDAPFSVDGSVHGEVPLVGFTAVDDGSGPGFEPNGWLVGVQQGGRGFMAARPVEGKMPAAAGGKMPAEEPGKMAAEDPDADAPATPERASGGVVSSPFAYDARAVLDGLGWSDAVVRVYAVRGALLSNGVTVTVAGGTDGGSVTEPRVVAIEVGGEPGPDPLSVKAPATTVTEPGGNVVLSGHVRASGSKAVVYLFATQDGPAGPFQNTIEVPLTDGLGTFAINLLGDNALPKAPGTWHVYAFSGEHVAGPATIELTPGAKPW